MLAEMANLSETITELRTLADSYKARLKPEAVAVGQILDARFRKTIRTLTEVDMQMQALTRQVRNQENLIMELQQRSVQDEKAADKKIEALKTEQASWAEEQRADRKRTSGEWDDDEEDENGDGDGDEDDFVYDSKRQTSDDGEEAVAGDLKAKAEKAMWAQELRDAHKRKNVPYPGNEDDDEDDDDISDQGDYKRPRVTSGDEDILTKIFEEVKSMVDKNPGCKGNTPIGEAFDPIRKLIKTKPTTFEDEDDTAFLIGIMEQARKVVKTFPKIKNSVGLGASFGRIRELLRDSGD